MKWISFSTSIDVRIEDGGSVQSKEGESVMNITTVGIDLAKKVFSVHGVDVHGKVAVKNILSCGNLL